MELIDFCHVDETQLLSLYHNTAVFATESFKRKWKQIYGEDLDSAKKILKFNDLTPATLDEFIEKSDLEKDWQRFRYIFLSKEIPEEISKNPKTYGEIIEHYLKLHNNLECVFINDGSMHITPKKNLIDFDKDVRARKNDFLSKSESIDEEQSKLMQKYSDYWDWDCFWFKKSLDKQIEWTEKKLTKKEKNYLKLGKDNQEYRTKYNDFSSAGHYCKKGF